ncbi:hypothetical protein [Streptomyces reticuli]|uniref:hypothetical protein n=1 Tax=Streptomyces reticuli TaxID=1926 RepID=UPI001927822A
MAATGGSARASGAAGPDGDGAAPVRPGVADGRFSPGLGRPVTGGAASSAGSGGAGLVAAPAGGGTTRSRRTSGPTRRSIQVRVAASTMVMLGTARGAGVTTTTWFGR